ncbi:P-loop containing nucleoside triphosphate hydrolase protein [Astrocystis sublimbata]|nr:P-loop containing nucleoside triphosphate hydrolase protein [Astrocystis sublimbata]
MLLTTYEIGDFLPPKDQQSESSFAMRTSTVDSPPIYSLHLISPAIVHALRSVVQYYPSQDLTGEIVIHWPYPILVHHYDELTKFRDEVAQKDANNLCEKEKGAYEDISLLLEYLDSTIMPKVLEEMKRNAEGWHTFEYSWVKLKPGTTILDRIREDSEHHPRVVHSISGGTFQHPPVPWEMTFWNLIYDGVYLGRQNSTMYRDKFDGEIEYNYTIVGNHDDIDDMDNITENISNQIKYGGMYWSYLWKQCRQCKGKTTGVQSQEIDGLVMVDMKLYHANITASPLLMDTSDCRKWTSDCTCKVCKSKVANNQGCKMVAPLFDDYNNITIEDEHFTLTPHQYFLCQFEIPAFVFKTRKWERVHVRDLSDPEFDEGLVNHLVMDPKRKLTLKALAKCFARVNKLDKPLTGEPWTADFVQGKGHGLIFLLHGRPGVGKTYTAEYIAAFTKRPLMVLTSSDIGTDPTQVEVNLTKQFRTARSWGAVLLIDEADVYMERRTTADLVRNSLVAAFLRALEFYDGILFLTTNRVGSFDDAFISRVHVQLYYPDFDDNQRQQIWKTFIDKLADERGDSMRLHIKAKDYIRGREIQELKWNGREIRNAFQTAVSLAEYDAEMGEDGKVMVTDEHLRAVVELSSDFKAYLNELHKGDEAKRSLKKYERLDSFTGPQSA